jgi:hypothetical protein
LRLFTISSDDWIKFDPADATVSKVEVPEEMSIVDRSIHLGVVMGIVSRLYTMAKMMQTIFLSYGVEVCPTSLSFLEEPTDIHTHY